LLYPTLTAVAFVIPVTCTGTAFGVLLSVVTPFPSCQALFSHQHFTVPPEITAQELFHQTQILATFVRSVGAMHTPHEYVYSIAQEYPQ
jgi:hypothetical protein